tara:strand:- start:890 stop:1213 length:324 start_codon:yes stop_codon:yes gene_type:complete
MCGGGGRRSSAPDNSAQLALQREQMAEQKRQFEIQRAESQARFEEQKRIQNAPPAPPPSPTAEVAGASLEITPTAQAPQRRTKGYGRRRLRTDLGIPGGGGAGVNIP